MALAMPSMPVLPSSMPESIFGEAGRPNYLSWLILLPLLAAVVILAVYISFRSSLQLLSLFERIGALLRRVPFANYFVQPIQLGNGNGPRSRHLYEEESTDEDEDDEFPTQSRDFNGPSSVKNTIKHAGVTAFTLAKNLTSSAFEERKGNGMSALGWGNAGVRLGGSQSRKQASSEVLLGRDATHPLLERVEIRPPLTATSQQLKPFDSKPRNTTSSPSRSLFDLGEEEASAAELGSSSIVPPPFDRNPSDPSMDLHSSHNGKQWV